MQSLWSSPELVQAVFCSSPAGTGKTSLAVLAGAYEIENEIYDKIIYLRNSVPVRNQGFLPGDLASKEYPYFQPLIESLDNVQPGLFEKWSRLDDKKEPKIVAKTTSYLRGVTFKRAYVILDEAQSWDLEELQTIYTRCSDDCKIVSIGSVRQNDNKQIKRIAGLTPFEVYMKHFENTNATFHKLINNYRGSFSSWADEVQDTIAELKKR